MLERHPHDALSPLPQRDSDAESWLMSYLDVLTLLNTLFVLLLAMTEHGQGSRENRSAMNASGSIAPVAQSAAMAVMSDGTPQPAGLLPRHSGLQPRFKGLETEGISVVEGEDGITLRIDNNLLFASGQAALTPRGEGVLDGLVETLSSVDGNISVVGHTDNLPINTARFPSNWELSAGRAISVLRYLATQGVSKDRLRAIGYADTQPLESNDSPAGRAANRRVELLIKQPFKG